MLGTDAAAMTVFLPAPIRHVRARSASGLTLRIVNREESVGACGGTVLLNSFPCTIPWGITLAGIVVPVHWFIVEPRCHRLRRTSDCGISGDIGFSRSVGTKMPKIRNDLRSLSSCKVL